VVLRSKEAGNAARGTLMRVRWMCIHHGSETANKRGLEEHVERDSPLLLFNIVGSALFNIVSTRSANI
jgi:hypothetical protein